MLHDRAICPSCTQRLYSVRVRTDAWLKCEHCKQWLYALLIPPHMAAGYLAGLLGDTDATHLLHALWPHHRQMVMMDLFAQSLTIGTRAPKILSVSASREEAETGHFDTAREIIHTLLKAS